MMSDLALGPLENCKCITLCKGMNPRLVGHLGFS